LFSLLRIEFGVIPSSKVDQCLTEWIYHSGGLILFSFEDIFPFYLNFKVLDIILEGVGHVLIVKGKYPNILEKVLYIYFYFIFISF
jgi:hypothetical protein